ncbi:MAG: hypothetical protein WA777_00765 [Rhodanobacter sp.]
MNIFIKLVSAAIISLSSGCSFAADSHLRDTCSPWLSTFYEMPLKQRLATFDSYSLDNQYQIFICGNQVVHPPAIYLAEPFARRGANAVPFLKAKLAQASDDLTIRDIVLVFVEMKRLNTYSISNDAFLAALVKRKVDDMRDANWRAVAQGNVSEMFGTR